MLVSAHGVYLDLVSNKIECKERRLLEYSEEDVEVQFWELVFMFTHYILFIQ